jgi:hypothetical protein
MVLLATFLILLNHLMDTEVVPNAIESTLNLRDGNTDKETVVDEFVREQALEKHKSFKTFLKYHWAKLFFLLGLLVSAGIYFILISSLFSRYFNMWPLLGKVVKFAVTTIECLPHALLVLFVYQLIRWESPFHPIILVWVYIIIAIPFVYSMMEDEFALAKKEGRIENLLIEPFSNLKIMCIFIHRNRRTLLLLPLSILTAMMVYMDFCFSGIGIYLGNKSPFQVFFGLWNSDNAHHHIYSVVMKREIFILLLLMIPLALLFLLFYKGTKNENY